MASEAPTYNVLIVGAGKIGAFFDTPKSSEVLTHAHAFSSYPGFRLKGFTDADEQRAMRAATLWGTESFKSITDAFEHYSIDVAVVAVPDEFHFQVLQELVNYPLKLVFAEKPLARSTSEAAHIIQLYKTNGIALAVNYSRRFVPEFTVLRESIAGNEFGKFLAGTGYYGKGTLHNGSHMIDLLSSLLGPPINIKTFGAIQDWSSEDPTCSAVLQLQSGGQFVLQAIDCRDYSVFEMDLFFERGRVRMLDSGFALEYYDVAPSNMFPGYQVLSEQRTESVALGRALYAAAANIYEHLSAGKHLACTGADGLVDLTICTEIAGTRI